MIVIHDDHELSDHISCNEEGNNAENTQANSIISPDYLIKDMEALVSTDVHIEDWKQKLKAKATKSRNKDTRPSSLLLHNADTKGDGTINTKEFIIPHLLRLFVKKGEFVYARPNDIVLIESCDHSVKVFLACDNHLKKTLRSETLKDFLMQLPENQFLRVGRFCAINSHRLSGGNCNDQSFEFDFKISIKLKHPISPGLFNAIGR